MVIVFVVGFALCMGVIAILMAIIFGQDVRMNALTKEIVLVKSRVQSLEKTADAVRDKFFETDEHLHAVANLAGIKWDNGTPPRWVKKK